MASTVLSPKLSLGRCRIAQVPLTIGGFILVLEAGEFKIGAWLTSVQRMVLGINLLVEL